MADQKIEAIFDDKELVAFFKNLEKKLKNVQDGEKKFVGLLSAIVFADIMDHFETEKGPSDPWEKWSDKYAEHMKEIGRGGNKILQFTGKLRNNFQPTDVRKTDAGFLWFNNAKTSGGFPYAAAHDEGGDTLPARPFMWLSEKGAENIADQTLAFMLEEGVA